MNACDLPGGGVADCMAPEINCSDRSLEAFIFYVSERIDEIVLLAFGFRVLP